ncbi:hypothetical protein D3C73_909530 [compost metagenome]
MDQQGLARLQAAALEDVGEDGEGGLGQGGGLDEVEAVGNRQGVAGVDQGVFRVAAAAQQGADPVADGPAADAFADRLDLAGDLQPQHVRSARRRRITALALDDIGTIHPGGAHADADLAGAGRGQGAQRRAQGLGRSLAAVDLDHPHGGVGRHGHGWLPRLHSVSMRRSHRRSRGLWPRRRG